MCGGAGFIGKHTARVLLESGREVPVIDRVGLDEERAGLEVRMETVDCGNQEFMTCKLRGVEEAVYLAYGTVPQTSYEDSVRDIIVNLPTAVNVLEAAEAAGVSRIIVFSSGGTVYGQANQVPVSEDYPPHPLCPYGVTIHSVE